MVKFLIDASCGSRAGSSTPARNAAIDHAAPTPREPQRLHPLYLHRPLLLTGRLTQRLLLPLGQRVVLADV